VQERSHRSPFLPPFPPWLILFPLHMPRHHVLSIVPCSCCPCVPFKISMTSLRALEVVCISHQPPHQVYSLHRLMPSPSPVFFASKDTGSSRQSCSCSFLKLKPALALLPSQNSYSCGPALLCPIGVPHVGNLPDGERSEANGGGAHDGGALFDVGFLWRSTDSSVAGLGFLCCWVTIMAERPW
jgi:hypothetical protein